MKDVVYKTLITPFSGVALDYFHTERGRPAFFYTGLMKRHELRQHQARRLSAVFNYWLDLLDNPDLTSGLDNTHVMRLHNCTRTFSCKPPVVRRCRSPLCPWCSAYRELRLYRLLTGLQPDMVDIRRVSILDNADKAFRPPRGKHKILCTARTIDVKGADVKPGDWDRVGLHFFKSTDTDVISYDNPVASTPERVLQIAEAEMRYSLDIMLGGKPHFFLAALRGTKRITKTCAVG